MEGLDNLAGLLEDSGTIPSRRLAAREFERMEGRSLLLSAAVQ